MQGTSTTSRGHKYWYYKCGAWDRATGPAGNHQRVPLEEIEGQVWGEIRKSFLDPSRREKNLREIREAQLAVLDTQTDELDALDAVIKDATSRIEKMWDAIETGSIETKQAAERIKNQTERKEGAQARIDDIGQKVRHIYLSDEQVNAVLDKLLRTEKQPGSVRLLIKMMSAKVIVAPDDIRVELCLAVVGAGERT